jgi:glucose-1-phosphate thymidylyltransferase
MKAIIPIAGIGTRLRPHTLIMPKVLINVGGKPIISYIIDHALRYGIDEFAFIIGYRGEQIKEFIQSHYSITYRFYEQHQIKGLAYAINLAEEFLRDEPVFIILGDTIFETDLTPVFKGAYSSLGVKTVEDPLRFGIAIVDKDGFITSLIEKPAAPESNLALVGLYYIKKGSDLKTAINELLRRDIKTNEEYQITDALQIMINQGYKFTTFSVEGWYDCGKPETILSTNRYLLSQYHQTYNIKTAVIRPPVLIAPDVTVEYSIIGPYVTISRGATIKNSIISNSIIGEESTIIDTFIKDSIIGNRATIKNSGNVYNVSDYCEVIL